MDPAVISYIGALHEHFINSHAKVHEDFVVSHEREHNLEDSTTGSALKLAAEKLVSEVGCIKEYYNALLVEQEKRYSERFTAQQIAMQAAFTASEEALKAALIEKEKSVEAAFAASEKAIIKAEVSSEKRADVTYVSLNELQRSLGNLMPRAESEARIANVEIRVASLNSRQDRQEGQSKGVTSTTAALAVIITIIISLLGVMIALIV